MAKSIYTDDNYIVIEQTDGTLQAFSGRSLYIEGSNFFLLKEKDSGQEASISFDDVTEWLNLDLDITGNTYFTESTLRSFLRTNTGNFSTSSNSGGGGDSDNIYTADGEISEGRVVTLSTTGSLTIQDDKTTPTGVTYLADYGETFTDRSLVDKGYVTSVIYEGSDQYATDVNRTIGILTTDDTEYANRFGITEYNGYTHGIEVTQSQTKVGNTNGGTVFLSSVSGTETYAGGDTASRVYVTSDFVDMRMSTYLSPQGYFSTDMYVRLDRDEGIEINDQENEVGAFYSADYSDNFTDRSLIDKAYSDQYDFTFASQYAEDTSREVGITTTDDTERSLRFGITEYNGYTHGVEITQAQVKIGNTNSGTAFLSSVSGTETYESSDQSSRVFVNSDTVELRLETYDGSSWGSDYSFEIDRTNGARIYDASGIGMQYYFDYSSNNATNSRWITDKGYDDSHIGGNDIDSTVSSPSSTEDGYVITWDNTNSEYILSEISSDNIYTADGNITENRSVVLESGIGLTFYGTNTDSFDSSSDNHAEFIVDYSAIEMNWNKASGDYISLYMNSSGIFYEDNFNYRGIRYAADYSSSFVDRSLVDKGYVDSVAGLIESQLLSSDVNIDGDETYNIRFGADSSDGSTGNDHRIDNFGVYAENVLTFEAGDQTADRFSVSMIPLANLMQIGSFNSSVQLTGLQFGNGTVTLYDSQNSTGIKYAADYSTNFTERSLVDKEYVDTEITATKESFDLMPYTATGSGADISQTTGQETQLAISTEVISNSNYSLSSNSITVSEAGIYQVSYTIEMIVDSTTGGTRGSQRNYIEINGTEVTQSSSYIYTRESVTGVGISSTFNVSISASDVITLITVNANGNPDISQHNTQISIIKLS